MFPLLPWLFKVRAPNHLYDSATVVFYFQTLYFHHWPFLQRARLILQQALPQAPIFRFPLPKQRRTPHEEEATAPCLKSRLSLDQSSVFRPAKSSKIILLPTNFSYHRVPQPWHDHGIFTVPSWEFWIILPRACTIWNDGAYIFSLKNVFNICDNWR